MKFISNKKLHNYRLEIFKVLENNKLKNELSFNKFLTREEIFDFDIWLNILSAKKNFNININKLVKLIEVYRNAKDTITFKKLFELDKDWYLFFHENADINGNPINNEKRLGVDRNYVMDITIIKNKVKLNLDESIDFYTRLKYIFFTKLYT